MDELEVIMFKEINDYSEKYYGLTFRQWIFSVLILIVVIPTYLLLPKYTPITSDIASYIVIVEAGIIGFFGFIKIHNLSAEHIVPYWYRHFLLFGKPLKYITDKEWKEMHEKKNKKNKKNKNGLKEVETVNVDTNNVEIIQLNENDVETKNNSVNESKLKLTKKQIKQQQKQEKMLNKAKKKYGYLLDDVSSTKDSNTEIKSNITNIDDENENLLNNQNEQKEKHNVAKTNDKDELNSFTPEQIQALKKILNDAK